MNNEELKSNLLSSRHWLRLVFMLLFAALLQVASIIMWVLVVLQFVFSLITGQDIINLRRFGHSLSTYIYQTLKFLTSSSEEKPHEPKLRKRKTITIHNLTIHSAISPGGGYGAVYSATW